MLLDGSEIQMHFNRLNVGQNNGNRPYEGEKQEQRKFSCDMCGVTIGRKDLLDMRLRVKIERRNKIIKF